MYNTLLNVNNTRPIGAGMIKMCTMSIVFTHSWLQYLNPQGVGASPTSHIYFIP